MRGCPEQFFADRDKFGEPVERLMFVVFNDAIRCFQGNVGVQFAETPELEILFIMGGNAEKFQNLKKHPEATVLVDTRDIGKVEAFDITRAWIQGLASEVTR
jgi:hypothetical protein